MYTYTRFTLTLMYAVYTFFFSVPFFCCSFFFLLLLGLLTNEYFMISTPYPKNVAQFLTKGHCCCCCCCVTYFLSLYFCVCVYAYILYIKIHILSLSVCVWGGLFLLSFSLPKAYLFACLCRKRELALTVPLFL